MIIDLLATPWHYVGLHSNYFCNYFYITLLVVNFKDIPEIILSFGLMGSQAMNRQMSCGLLPFLSCGAGAKESKQHWCPPPPAPIEGSLLDVLCKLENVVMAKGPPTVDWRDTERGEKCAVTGS